MARDHTQAVRRGLLEIFKGDGELTEIVQADQIYTQVAENPGWPFIRCGSPTVVPLRASCLDGAEITIAIHGFARSRPQGGVTVETAEDHASRMGAAIAKAVDGKRFQLPNGYARVAWEGSQLLVDGAEATAFHTIQNFRVRCVTGASA